MATAAAVTASPRRGGKALCYSSTTRSAASSRVQGDPEAWSRPRCRLAARKARGAAASKAAAGAAAAASPRRCPPQLPDAEASERPGGERPFASSGLRKIGSGLCCVIGPTPWSLQRRGPRLHPRRVLVARKGVQRRAGEPLSPVLASVPGARKSGRAGAGQSVHPSGHVDATGVRRRPAPSSRLPMRSPTWEGKQTQRGARRGGSLRSPPDLSAGSFGTQEFAPAIRRTREIPLCPSPATAVPREDTRTPIGTFAWGRARASLQEQWKRTGERRVEGSGEATARAMI
jgi:hypothetical protein